MRPLLLTLLLVTAGCGGPTPTETRAPQDEDLLGVVFREAAALRGWTVGPDDLLQEPPGIGRGLKVHEGGEDVWVYVNRFPLKNVPTRDAQVEIIRDMKIIGVARKKDGLWVNTGMVVPHWHHN